MTQEKPESPETVEITLDWKARLTLQDIREQVKGVKFAGSEYQTVNKGWAYDTLGALLPQPLALDEDDRSHATLKLEQAKEALGLLWRAIHGRGLQREAGLGSIKGGDHNRPTNEISVRYALDVICGGEQKQRKPRKPTLDPLDQNRPVLDPQRQAILEEFQPAFDALERAVPGYFTELEQRHDQKAGESSSHLMAKKPNKPRER